MDYDAIVLGLGAHGSAATAELARRGLQVLGLEAFGRAHDLGSSGGLTRMIRLAYPTPGYAALLWRAWKLWEDLQAEVSEEIFIESGELVLGPYDSGTISALIRSSTEQHLPHDVLEAAEIRYRFPAFSISDDARAIHEQRAGFLYAQRCIEALLRRAEAHGADLRFDERATSWRTNGSGVEVHSDRGTYRASRLIVAVGAWTKELLPQTPFELRIERIPLFWLEPQSPRLLALPQFPPFIMETVFDGAFFGFPYLEDQGLKVARNGSDQVVDSPRLLDREERAADVRRLREFLRRHLCAANGTLRATSVCMYYHVADSQFVIDHYNEDDRVVYASACNGHGFKFAPAIGLALADLATSGRTDLGSQFSSARFSESPYGGQREAQN